MSPGSVGGGGHTLRTSIRAGSGSVIPPESADKSLSARKRERSQQDKTVASWKADRRTETELMAENADYQVGRGQGKRKSVWDTELFPSPGRSRHADSSKPKRVGQVPDGAVNPIFIPYIPGDCTPPSSAENCRFIL